MRKPKYTCKECGTICTGTTNLNRHFRLKHHGITPAAEDSLDENSEVDEISSTPATDDIQPKQILQRVRKTSIDSRSDKEKFEECDLLHSVSNTSNKSLNQSQEYGSDDEYHSRRNRGDKDDRFKHDLSNLLDGQQSHQKDVFVQRGEPSRRERRAAVKKTRRGRGRRRTTDPIVKRIDNYGPPNAKSPFEAGGDEGDLNLKPDSIEESVVKKIETQSTDESVAHAIETSGKFRD